MRTSAPVRPTPRHATADLVRAYLPGSFFHRSARGTLLADGVHALVAARPGSHGDAAADAVQEARANGTPEPFVVGALGFAPDAPSSLVVPAVVRHAPPDRGRPLLSPPAAQDCRWTLRHRPDPAVYLEGVRRALHAIESGALRKVVLARCLELSAADPVAVPELLARLVAADPDAYTYAVDVTAPGDPATRTLIGASPELLVSRYGARVHANPLAGSTPRSGDEAEDRRRIAALRASGKDRREHALVVEQVADVLSGLCSRLEVPSEPDVLGTATMWHLSTRIRGEVAGPSVTSLHLAEALHPTAAVCGVPSAAAGAVIREVEAVDRGFYSGLTGWTDAEGDGEWVVAIRSAEVCGRTLRMFAGAGVVGGSEPEAELRETSAKFATLLRAIGVDLVP